MQNYLKDLARRDNLKLKIIFAFCVVILIFAFFIFILTERGNTKEQKNLDAFAKCLAGKGYTMYGAYWCPHCQNEKRAFGDSFRFVSYVECSDEPKQCTDAGIGGFPTWISADGKKLEGEQGIKKLSEISGCSFR